MELKYLYTAEFEDGNVFVEPADDHSELDPKRSAFYDLLQDKRKIVKFTITDGVISHSVDLLDGHFEVNGNSFKVEGKTPLPIVNPEYRLVFYRRHQIDTVTNIDSILGYYIGWQCTIEHPVTGKVRNYQQVINIY